VLAVPWVLGLSLTLGGCGFPSFGSLPAPRAVSGPTYPISADFRDTLNLPVGAKVKLNGTVIGDVSSITTSDYVAHVGMQVSRSVTLSRGTTFQIRFTTPLGENYVAATPPRTVGPALAAGARVALDQTDAAPTIEDVFASLSVLINGGGLNQIGSIVKELDTAFEGRGATVRSILARTRLLVSSLNVHRDQVDRALDALNALAVEADRGTKVIDQGLEDFPKALAVLASQTAKLHTLLVNVDSLGEVATSVLRRSTAALVADVDDLAPVLHSLAGIRSDLAPTLEKLIAFGTKLSSAAPGDYLDADATFSLLVDGSPPILPPTRGGGR
jgi:phospholipid/cholesterol/gamma-HCH transport system substrate-binding protein